MAEQALRKVLGAEPTQVVDDERGRTVDDAANALRERLELQGARKSYRQNCESMQRVHISPAMGSRRVGEVSTADVEALARSMLRRGLAPKSVRNVITFLRPLIVVGASQTRSRGPLGLAAAAAAGAPTCSSSRWRSSRP
jgi:hypothetical protein